MVDKDLAIRFHQRVRELDRNYEKLNNQDFDNGVYHKYAYKQKGKKPEDKKDELKEEEIRQSDVNMNNLVSEAKAEVLRKRKRENADLNYHNYYVKISKYQPSSLTLIPYRPSHYQRHHQTWLPTTLRVEVPQRKRQQPLFYHILSPLHGPKLLIWSNSQYYNKLR